MNDRVASRRTGTQHDRARQPDDPRIHVTLEQLRALERRAQALTFLPRQPARSVLNGRHASRIRGRGLNFEELRDYLPGDDVRAIDWKVTARTGQPHVRVMTEERDRPALMVVDQRMSMYFGSVHAMKAVTAAEAAALAAFRILDQGDRIGGIVFGDDHVGEIRPKRSHAALHQLLAALVRANQTLQADAPNRPGLPLVKVLQSVQRIASKDHLILLFSDFDGIDASSDALIAGLARHNDLVLVTVTDPISNDIPQNMRAVVSDGSLQAEIDTSDGAVHHALSAMAQGRLARVVDWQRRFGVPVVPLSSAEDALPQLRRLMGLQPR
ncbi:MAG: DUF58 domain-containing protein [Pseudomonadota bacterium]